MAEVSDGSHMPLIVSHSGSRTLMNFAKASHLVAEICQRYPLMVLLLLPCSVVELDAGPLTNPHESN